MADTLFVPIYYQINLTFVLPYKQMLFHRQYQALNERCFLRNVFEYLIEHLFYTVIGKH